MEILIALTQLLNTFLGGYANETTSSRAYRMKNTSRHWMRFHNAIDFIFYTLFKQKQHCRQSYLNNQRRLRQCSAHSQ